MSSWSLRLFLLLILHAFSGFAANRCEDLLQARILLGEGGSTRIFDLGNGWASRIAKDPQNPANLQLQQGFLNLQKELKEAGIPVVEIDESRSHPPYSVVVKKENFLFRLDQFVDFEQGKWPNNYSDNLIAQAREDLKKFMKTTWGYLDISDVNPTQIGYNGQEWILFDFYGHSERGHRPLRNFKEKQFLMEARGDIDRLSPQLEKEISKAIETKRNKMKNQNDWYERTTDRSGDFGELVDRVTPHPLPSTWNKSLQFNDGFLNRYFQGLIPKQKFLSLQIETYDGESGPFAEYKVQVNGRLKARLLLVVDGRKGTFSLIQSQLKEILKEGRPFLVGSDFILIYKKKDIDELESVATLD